jgi:hypothetical protein
MRAMFIQLSIALLTLIVPEIWKDTFEGLRRSKYWRFIQIAVIIWIAVVVWIGVSPSAISWANRNRTFAVIIASAVGAVIFGTAAWHWITSPSPISQSVRANRPKLTLLKIPDNEFVFSGREDIKTTPEFFRDRKQYRLVVENESQADLTDLKLDIQFPYPVETSYVNANYEARGVVFKPQNMEMTAQGNVEAPRLFTSIYELSATELINQKARFEVVFVLNSSGDWMPESGPLSNYIDGGFKIKAEDGRTQDEHFYTPIILNDDKTISLGSLTEPPDKLIHRTLHVTSLPPPAAPAKTTIDQLSNSELKQRATRIYRKIDDIDHFYDDGIHRAEDRKAKHEITEEQFHEIWIASLRRGGDEFDKSVRADAAIVLAELRKRIPYESRKHIVGLPDLLSANPKDGSTSLYFAVPATPYGFTHLLAREIEQLAKLLPDD